MEKKITKTSLVQSSILFLIEQIHILRVLCVLLRKNSMLLSVLTLLSVRVCKSDEAGLLFIAIVPMCRSRTFSSDMALCVSKGEKTFSSGPLRLTKHPLYRVYVHTLRLTLKTQHREHQGKFAYSFSCTWREYQHSEM